MESVIHTTPREKKASCPDGWELKALKTIAAMSDETHCFTARLYIGGKLACDVSNHGHGGPNMERWASDEAKAQAMTAVAGTQDLSAYGITDPLSPDSCFEITIGGMVNDALLMKEAKRFAKRGKYPSVVWASDGIDEFLFGLRNPDNLDKFLREYNAVEYRVFHLA